MRAAAELPSVVLIMAVLITVVVVVVVMMSLRGWRLAPAAVGRRLRTERLENRRLRSLRRPGNGCPQPGWMVFLEEVRRRSVEASQRRR